MCASLTSHASTKKLERQPATAHSGTFDSKTTFEQRNTIQMVCLSTYKGITRKACMGDINDRRRRCRTAARANRGARAFGVTHSLSMTDSKLPSFRDRLHFLRHTRASRSPVRWRIKRGP